MDEHKKELTAGLLTRDDGIAYVQKILDAREHWCIVAASEQSLDLMEGIEQTFCADGSMIGMVVPLDGMIIGLGLVPKSKMSPESLARCANLPEAPHGRDILLTPDMPLSVIQWLTKTFHSDNLN